MPPLPRYSPDHAFSAAEPNGVLSALSEPLIVAPTAEPYVLELAAEALGAAKDAGASYADVRIGRYRRQSVNTRERQITGVSDAESYGLGVRALVNGSWGFAATSAMNTEGVVKAAREAARIAKGREGRAETSDRIGTDAVGERHVDDARHARSGRSADRGEGRAAVRGE